MSDLPGCVCRRSLSVSGFAPRALLSTSTAICGPARLERYPRPVHPYRMEGRGWIGRHGFWPLALLWLPAGVVAQTAMRFGGASFEDPGALLAALGSLAPVALCGLPLALGCRSLQRLGYRRAAWAVGIGLGVPTVAGTVVAGLLGPPAIAVWAVLLSLPAWIVRWWLARPRIGVPRIGSGAGCGRRG